MEVVTFCFHGWCMLGELFVAGIHPSRTRTNRVHITCSMPSTMWYEGTAQLFGRVETAFVLSCYSWLKLLPNEGGEETGARRESPQQQASESPTYYGGSSKCFLVKNH